MIVLPHKAATPAETRLTAGALFQNYDHELSNDNHIGTNPQ